MKHKMVVGINVTVMYTSQPYRLSKHFTHSLL